VLDLCLAEEVPAGKVNSIADIFADEHFLARGNLASVPSDELGEVVVPGVVPTLSATPGRIDHLGPPLGNATTEVLQGLLGLHADELARLRQHKPL
jgi:succinyl-CoA:(S)-malate CoA-transferase subunit A